MRTVADALTQSREILKDSAGDRYSTASLIRFINDAIVEARSLRPDLFVFTYDTELSQVNLTAALGNALVCDRQTTADDTLSLLYSIGSLEFSQYPGALDITGLVSFTPVEGQVVMVQEQGALNGVYTATTTLMDGLALVRHASYQTMLALSSAVVEYNDRFYKCTNNTYDVLYTDPIVWVEVYADRIPLPDQLFTSLVYYITGRAELRDDEFAVDGRAMTLMSAFQKKLIQGG